MYDYHIVLSLLSIGLGLIGYIFYFGSIFRGITKPHIFTWFTYGVIDVIVFIAQLVKGAGPGAWTLGVSALVCFIVAAVSLRRGEKHITKSDWVAFVSAFVAIALWRIMDDPLVAVVIAVLVNVLALAPTFRKSYIRPFEESISMWGFDIAKYALSIFALVSLNLTTVLFPLAVVVCNSVLVSMILYRRKTLAASGSVR